MLDKETLQVVVLSGAGGVGKTSVVKEMENLCKDKIPFSVTKSTTRASYASMGITDETEALSPEVSFPKWEALQNRIFQDYCANLVTCVRNAAFNNEKLLVVDRSPWDHTSYFLQQAPQLDLRTIEQRLIACQDVFETVLTDFGDRVNVTVWSFSYPTSWALDDKDEWRRHAPAAKNYIWSLSLRQMIETELRTMTRKVQHHTFAEYDVRSVNERAEKILSSVELLTEVKSLTPWTQNENA
jgi:hypothetical protein